MDEFSLTGRVAIISGASRGIGRAIALRYARAGASVVVSSRKLDGVQAVAQEIQAAGGEALAVQAHVGDAQAIDNLVTRTIDAYDRVDILVNNAATNPHFGPILTSDEGQWNKTFDTNTLGVFRGCKAVAEHMQAQGGGKIINTVSVTGIQPAPGLGLYGVTKAAVIMLTRVLALELGHANIQVNAIAPGVIKTRMSQVLWDTPTIAEPLLQRLPLGHFGEPEDIAGLALYLASSASNYVTGAIFHVDGGMQVAVG